MRLLSDDGVAGVKLGDETRASEKRRETLHTSTEYLGYFIIIIISTSLTVKISSNFQPFITLLIVLKGIWRKSRIKKDLALGDLMKVNHLHQFPTQINKNLSMQIQVSVLRSAARLSHSCRTRLEPDASSFTRTLLKKPLT